MRVRVDQTPAARSTRGKSGGAGSMPLAGASPPERTPSQATSVLWPSACRIAGLVAGRYAYSAIATERTAVCEVVEHRVELGRLVVVLRQLPGLRALDEPVELPHDVPDRLQRARELPRFEPAGDLVVQRVEPGGDLRSAGPGRQLAVPVAGDHRRRPRHEVAELVRQLPLIAFVERVLGGRTVASERRRTNGPVAHRIAPVRLHERERVDDVAERLRDLRALHRQVAVHEELLRYVVARRHEHCGPVHAVEAKDVLAEHMASSRPVRRHEVLARTGVRERAQVVDERVSPDVGDLALVPRQRDAPGLARAADGEVLQAAGDEAPRLVVAERRLHEVGPLVVEREQPLLIRGQPEEVVLLLDVLDAISVLGALAVDELVL